MKKTTESRQEEQRRDYILIEDISPADRPREKAIRGGIRTLSNAELIAILFGNGIKGKSVLTMSQELLGRYGGYLQTLHRKSIKEIIRDNPGIGPAKAVSLAAAIELGMRCRDEQPMDKPRITGSDSIYSLMRGELEWLTHEEFWVVCLTRGNQVHARFRLSSGGTSATVVDCKLLFKKVLDEGDVVSAIILIHNHPSGTCRPSIEDDRLTQKISDGAKLLDIKLLDHMIITPSTYYSYCDEGRLP